MKRKLPNGRVRIILASLGVCLSIAVVLGFSSLLEQPTMAGPDTGTLEKMIVAEGTAAMDIDLNKLNGVSGRTTRESNLRFSVQPEAFYTILVFENELRGPLPSSMELIPQGKVALPGTLNASYNQLAIESTPLGSPYELVVRDAKSGFVFFNIEGHQFEYQPNGRVFNIDGGRLLLSKDYASELGRPTAAGTVIGKLSVAAAMRAVEVTELVQGEVTSTELPATDAGSIPGPDVIVGDLVGLQQFGAANGGRVGLAVGTDSCNAGTINLHWVANPGNDHPVIPQNLYRMSGGASNNERFEQIGQSSVKHAFTALTENICGFGCNGVGGANLGSGCSDPYSASLNSGPNLGSRAWINPFTGAYPRNDSQTPNNSHPADHNHSSNATAHRILTEIADLSTSQNPGATYYAEAQYITPHEYAWCQANPGQCNMYNNVSYRRYNVSGTASPFSFSAVGSTVRMQPAINAWPGATIVEIKPDAGNDGIGFIAYKVTNPSAGVWHYEYAIYNQNLDRAIQSFSLPTWLGVPITNVGFHAPPQHPGWSGDGTVGNAGFSNAPWTQTQLAGSLSWSAESLTLNPNANVIRWGTMYNFRFDSNRPPMTVNATIGFFKAGNPVSVQVQAPSANPGPRPCYERQPQTERCAPVS